MTADWKWTSDREPTPYRMDGFDIMCALYCVALFGLLIWGCIR